MRAGGGVSIEGVRDDTSVSYSTAFYLETVGGSLGGLTVFMVMIGVCGYCFWVQRSSEAA